MMSSLVTFYVFSAFLLIMFPGSLQDPCSSYQILSDASRSVFNVQSSFLNDRTNGWYRFVGKAGNKILDYPPDKNATGYRCAASKQGWMTGKHPRGSEGNATRTVCFWDKTSRCVSSVSIKAKNCGDFFVYQLPDLSNTGRRWCGAGEVVNNGPCKKFQLLTEPNRLNTYHDRDNKYCDGNLDGWYRFWGEAGHQLLNKCPARTDNRFSCGSHNQGWLNATNPVPLDGVVNRTVCFSHFYKCQCYYYKQIQMRNCGEYFVYKLAPIENCKETYKSRYCGIKDKNAHVVTCSPNYMRIDLDRRYYNSSKYASITLKDPSCSYTLSYDHISLGTIPSRCGAMKSENAKEIVYKNSVKLEAHFGEGIVTRDHDEYVNFQCSYPRESFIDNGASFAPVVKIVVSNLAIGNFSFNFNTYTKRSYENPVTSYPLKVKLRDNIYFEINATITDSSLRLFIDNCYATPTMDHKHPAKYYIIKNGCITDATTEFIPSFGVRRRFKFQAFRYENSTTAYLHCLVFLCFTNTTNDRCFTGCYGNKLARRSRRDLSTPSKQKERNTLPDYYLLDSDQMTLDSPIDTSKKEKGSSEKSDDMKTIILVAIGVLAVGVVAIIVAVVGTSRRKRRSEKDRGNTGKEVGFDNKAIIKDDELTIAKATT